MTDTEWDISSCEESYYDIVMEIPPQDDQYSDIDMEDMLKISPIPPGNLENSTTTTNTDTTEDNTEANYNVKGNTETNTDNQENNTEANQEKTTQKTTWNILQQASRDCPQ